MSKRIWLMKSEPSTYSIDDLKRDGNTHWSGVRNYQARNFLRDEIKMGDWVLFYHSNADPAGIAGIARVCREGYADHTAWDQKSQSYDPKSSPSKPLWFMVDVEFMEKFPHFVSLAELKGNKKLKEMWVLRRGMRLSVQPVAAVHFELIKKIGKGI